MLWGLTCFNAVFGVCLNWKFARRWHTSAHICCILIGGRKVYIICIMYSSYALYDAISSFDTLYIF